MNDAQKRALEFERAMEFLTYLRANRPRGYSLGELSAEFKLDAAQVHLHLSRLVDVELVETDWRGRTVIYRAIEETG